jgi:hypothetical protein
VQEKVVFKVEEEKLSLRSNPRKTLYHFAQAIVCFVHSIKLPSRESLYALGGSIGIAGVMFVHAKSGNYGDDLAEGSKKVEKEVLEAIWWIFCGILSTAGMGCGLQTGALFLFPHVAQLALHATDGSLLWAAFWPGFWAGTGSAIGELVPFLLARAMRRAGRDPFSLLDASEPVNELEHKRQSSFWTPRVLLANSRKAMERQLATGSFWKIFILASIPNALFDLCGLVCGSMDVMSLSSFFLAVWTAKAFVRTPLQTCSLALAVAAATSETDSDSVLISWGKDIVVQLTEQEEDGSALVAILKTLWTFVACAMFGYFVLATVEQVAQHHAKSQRRISKHF